MQVAADGDELTPRDDDGSAVRDRVEGEEKRSRGVGDRERLEVGAARGEDGEEEETG